jgi:hypothetical protein
MPVSGAAVGPGVGVVVGVFVGGGAVGVLVGAGVAEGTSVAVETAICVLVGSGASVGEAGPQAPNNNEITSKGVSRERITAATVFIASYLLNHLDWEGQLPIRMSHLQ